MLFLVSILRLPVKHCILNPIELAWANMKTYVRTKNTEFNLTDVTKLAHECMDQLDPASVEKYFRHVQECENTFKKADRYMEQIEEDITEDDDVSHSDSDS